MVKARPWYQEWYLRWKICSNVPIDKAEWDTLSMEVRQYLLGLIETEESENFKLEFEAWGKMLSRIFGGK